MPVAVAVVMPLESHGLEARRVSATSSCTSTRASRGMVRKAHIVQQCQSVPVTVAIKFGRAVLVAFVPRRRLHYMP